MLFSIKFSTSCFSKQNVLISHFFLIVQGHLCEYSLLPFRSNTLMIQFYFSWELSSSLPTQSNGIGWAVAHSPCQSSLASLSQFSRAISFQPSPLDAVSSLLWVGKADKGVLETTLLWKQSLVRAFGHSFGVWRSSFTSLFRVVIHKSELPEIRHRGIIVQFKSDIYAPLLQEFLFSKGLPRNPFLITLFVDLSSSPFLRQCS